MSSNWRRRVSRASRCCRTGAASGRGRDARARQSGPGGPHPGGRSSPADPSLWQSRAPAGDSQPPTAAPPPQAPRPAPARTPRSLPDNEVGATLRSRATVAAMPSGSLVAVHSNSVRPARHDELRLSQCPRPRRCRASVPPGSSLRPGPALRSRVAPCATVRAHDEMSATPRLSCGLSDRRKYRAVADRTSSPLLRKHPTKKIQGSIRTTGSTRAVLLWRVCAEG